MIIVALPTIVERGDAWQSIAAKWYERTPEPVVCVPSWRKGSWCDGLNEVWENHGDIATLFICGSDDMVPRDGWLEAVKSFLDEGIIAPQVHDPRFSRWGPEVKDGDKVEMSSFPIISKKWLSRVFPLPSGLHYYGDNLISDRAGSTIAVPSCVIDHLMDERGRGAGMGDETTRMRHDKSLYKKVILSSTFEPLRDETVS